MKKLISFLLVLVICVYSTYPTFATTNDVLTTQIEEFQNYVTECESYYIYYDYITPPIGPSWSQSSEERMKYAIETARNAEINTIEELENVKEEFDLTVSSMTLDKTELEFMIYLFEKEKNDDYYYDDETWNSFQSVLKDGKQALETGDEEIMYCTYIRMRNKFNELCKYNNEYGDFNGDGVLNVLDITFAQKYLVNSVEFNSSQLTISQFNFSDSLRIDDLTNLQKYIIGTCEKMNNSHLDSVLSLEDLDEDVRKFTPDFEKANFVYNTERLRYFYYAGKTFSIIGDSYSAYEGWIPEGYKYWYTTDKDTYKSVTSPTQMWWYILSNTLKMPLICNGSWAGTTICTTGYSGADYTASAFVTRVKSLFGEDNTTTSKPDIIFVFGGTNDYWAKSPVGELKYSDWTDDDLKSVLPAFCYLLDYIKIHNPHATIINIVNVGLVSTDIGTGMATACEHYGAVNIELTDIDKLNAHPSATGQAAIAKQVFNKMHETLLTEK